MSGLLEGMAEAAVIGAKMIKQRVVARRRTRSNVIHRRPGDSTPIWNVLVRELRAELVEYGSKARLARYLGIPRQRVGDFLKGNRRLPDAETTLMLMHWLGERRAGRDPSL
ncbi:hypothetical protein [Synoicihabitans lomoniglobus]|nr:hypothetical protein [Opitutaceae bacterium LMO-M01]